MSDEEKDIMQSNIFVAGSVIFVTGSAGALRIFGGRVLFAAVVWFLPFSQGYW
jgi:hypothetical protein